MPKLLDTVTLSNTAADNSVEFDVKNRETSIIHIDYAKGNETSLDIDVEYSLDTDTEGTEDWYKLSSVVGGAITTDNFTMALSGKVRLEIPSSKAEDKIRISVAAVGGTVFGTLSLSAENNRLRG